MAIAITLSNLTIAVNARPGTLVGTFNTAGLLLTTNPFGWFVIVEQRLCTTWNGQAMPGPQPVQVSAPDGTLTSFTISITAAAAAVPVQVTLSPSTVSVSVSAAPNTKLSTAAVKMSDGSAYAGTLTVTPTGTITPSGMDLRLSRALTTADGGTHNCTVTAGTITAPLVLTVTSAGISPDGTISMSPNGPALVTTAGTWTWSSAAAGRSGEYNINLNGASAPGIGNLMEVADKGQLYVHTAASGWYVWNNGFIRSSGPGAGSPVPKSVTLTPPSATLPDSSPINTLISKAVVTMSDGSAYTGALTVAPSGMASSSGSSLVLSRALAAADDGVHNFTVTAGPVSATLALTITAATAPTPIITVNPAAPQIPDTTSKGAVVATFTVTMSDGSPFIGKVSFSAPNFDSGGIFALSGSNIIVSPTGPGVGPNLGTITDHITLLAVQP